MYVDQLRSTWKRALAYVAVCALASAIVFSGESDGDTFRQRVLYNLILSFCVGSLLWLELPALTFYTERLRPTPRWALRIAGALLTLNAGISVGLAVLAMLHVFPWEFYWTRVWESIAPTMVIGLICVVGLTMYRNLKYRTKYETAQARLSSLESRLHPHFLFNTLNSIMALIPEDPKAAERVTERLAALLRYSLDSTGHSTVPLAQEVKVATDYLEIEKTRFGDRLQYSIDVPDHLMQAEVPPLAE